MRYRKLDPNGDYTFGHGKADFLVNSPATVAQAIQTALQLEQSEWFLDSTAGVPYHTQILGYGTQSLYDAVIKAAILAVQGVSSIISYSSTLNPTTRLLTITATVTTQFSTQPITIIVQPNVLLTGYGAGGYGAQGGYGL